MDITQYSLEALKALAYDLIAQSEQVAKNLKVVNQEIALKTQKATEPQPAVEGEVVESTEPKQEE